MVDAMAFSFENFKNACTDAGLSEDEVCRILDEPDECREIVQVVVNRANILLRQDEAAQSGPERQKKLERAKNGAPPSEEDLREVDTQLAGWINCHNNGTILTTALRCGIHLRPEIYAGFTPQLLAFFQMYFVLGYCNTNVVAELLDFECDLPPHEGDGYFEGRPARSEWQHVKGRKAGEMVWDLFHGAMCRRLAEIVVRVYQEERESLLTQQKERATALGFLKPISEMETGLPKAILDCLETMDIHYLPELERVTSCQILDEGRRSRRRVGDRTIKSLSNFLKQHGLSLKPETPSL